MFLPVLLKHCSLFWNYRIILATIHWYISKQPQYCLSFSGRSTVKHCALLLPLFYIYIYILLKCWAKVKCIFQSVKAYNFNYNRNSNISSSFKLQPFACLLPLNFLCHLFYHTDAEILYTGNSAVLWVIL